MFVAITILKSQYDLDSYVVMVYLSFVGRGTSEDFLLLLGPKT